MVGRTIITLAAIACIVPAGSGMAAASTSTPKCAASDSVVLYDAKTKSYTPMTKTSSMNKTSTTSSAVEMCKSQATKMGAKLSSMEPAPQRTGAMNGVNGSFNGPSPEPTETGATPAPGPPSHTP
jgi:hypothetical protein